LSKQEASPPEWNSSGLLFFRASPAAINASLRFVSKSL
jgi:hypothetical protein